MKKRPPNGFKEELQDESGREKSCLSSEEQSERKASLNSRKEQKRRLQIRTSCQQLCDLLPFVNGQLDTATTLELTAKYINYLKETLPPDILSKVNKAVEQNVSSLQKNIQRPQKKRRTIRLKRNTSQRAKVAAKNSAEDHVSRRCTEQNCKQANQPSTSLINPLTVDLMLPPAEGLTSVHVPPILLDKSAVPRGQMLPVCQDQFFSASYQSVENNWMNPGSTFMNPTSCTYSSAVISHSLPEMGPGPSGNHVLWDALPGLVDPVALPSVVNFGQAYNQPEQSAETNFLLPSVDQGQIDSSVVGLPDGVSLVDFTNQPLTPLFQSALSSSADLTAENVNQPVSDALCYSRHFQDSDLCSSSLLTDSAQDVVSSFWLDLLLDTNVNLCFPDANVVNMVLSPYKGSN